MIHVVRKVHQKYFHNFHREEGLSYIVGYNVQFWCQVTLLQLALHITLTLQIFPLLQKLVIHILSVIIGLMVHPFEATQKISWIYQQLHQQGELRPRYLYIWLDHWSFCMFYNVKWKTVFQGHQQFSATSSSII